MASHKTIRLTLKKSLKLALAALTYALILAVPGESEAAQVKLALSKMTPYGSIELSGIQSRLRVFLPIPRRWQVNQAQLSLSYTNSSALLAERSRLVVSLNDFVLGQKTLHPDAPQGIWKLDLPAALLPADYNSLEFRVIQNYTYECTDPKAPELWTRLNLDKSYLELDYFWQDVPLSLAGVVDYIFDPKLPLKAALHLVIPTLDAAHLRLAALTASAAAIRYDYRPLELTISDQVVPFQDNIFIGDTQSLAQLLGQDASNLPPGHISVMPLPGPQGPDSRFAFLALSGDSVKAVERSAQAFSLISYPWPHETSMTAVQVKWPEVTRYSGKNMLTPGETYYFRGLGYSTVTRRGLNPGPVELNFRLPGDVVSPSNAPLVINLNLAYGAGMRPESTLNILLNRKYVTAVPLNETSGGIFQGYRLNIPTKYLQAGANILTFDPILTPNQNEPCQFLETGNLVLTVFEDSTIELPEMDHWAALPDLGVFAENGFPLNRWPDWRTTTLALTDHDWVSAGAALNLVAMISQKVGLPPFRLQTALGPAPKVEQDLLLVGPWDTWPPVWREASPLSQKAKYPFNSGVPALEKFKSWWLRFFPESLPRRSLPSPLAEIMLSEPLKTGLPLLTEFEAPGGTNLTVVGLTGQDPHQVWQAAQALWDPALQAQLSGETALLDLSSLKPQAVSRPAERNYFIGTPTEFSLLDQIAHEYPTAFFVILGVLIILVAWLILALLRRVKAKRLSRGGTSK